MALAGLVLHASRCGSTLLARALAVWPGVVAVNEPPELDDALVQARRGGDPGAVGTVLAGFGTLGERVVVKTDSWHVLEAERLVRAARVPWVFVHRDPAEILVSHLWRPGSQVVPGLLDEVWFGPPRTFLPTEHAPDVLGAIYAAAADAVGPGTLVDHADLPGDVARVAARFGLDPAAADPARFEAVLHTNAKRPAEVYVDDREVKRAAITPELAAAAERVQPAYDEMLASGSRVAAA